MTPSSWKPEGAVFNKLGADSIAVFDVRSADFDKRVGMVSEKTGAKRNRIFSYTEYIRILNEGTELPGNGA